MEHRDDIIEKTWNSGKGKDETLERRITSSWTISGRKELNHLDEIRIRFIVCLSFIKLNWWQTMDFAYYLFFLKSFEKRYSANLRKSSWTTGKIEKNEWIKMIIKEKESWTNHCKNSEWLMKENESPRKIRRTNMLEGI